MVDAKETMLDWLRDAYAMEDSMIEVLEKQSKTFENNVLVSGKIREHLQVTKEQRDQLKGLIEKLGAKPSAMKTMTGNLFANVQAIAGASAPDAIVKSCISNFAAENFEIACYTSLIAAAEFQGQTEVVRVCRGILEQEREMASWLQANIPHVTTEYLGKKQAKTT